MSFSIERWLEILDKNKEKMKQLDPDMYYQFLEFKDYLKTKKIFTKECIMEGIKNAKEYFGDNAKFKMPLDIIFKADGGSVKLFLQRLKENYPEFIFEENSYVYHIDDNYETSVAVSGYLTDIDKKDDIIKLIHHAEAFYSDTNFEHVHVEVMFDKTWRYK